MTDKLPVQSVLENVTASEVQDFGFPVLILENALPAEYFNALSSSFPDLSKDPSIVFSESSSRQRWEAQQCLDDASLPDIWRDFISYHASAAFFSDFCRVFGAGMHTIHRSTEHTTKVRKKCCRSMV